MKKGFNFRMREISINWKLFKNDFDIVARIQNRQ